MTLIIILVIIVILIAILLLLLIIIMTIVIYYSGVHKAGLVKGGLAIRHVFSLHIKNGT